MKGRTFMGMNGIVVSGQPLASQAGLDILKAGGNAFDAAIVQMSSTFFIGMVSRIFK